MIKIRLFWKIFFAFWLASLLLVLSTTLLVLYTGGSDRAKQRHQEMIEELSQFVIQQHESGQEHGARALKKIIRREFSRSEREGPGAKPAERHPRESFSLQIFDGDTLIFQNRRNIGKAPLATFGIINGSDGKIYNLYASELKTPGFVIDTLKALTRLQFLLIFIFAGLVSLILSLSISRPLKNLSVFSQQVTRGDLSEKIDESLLKRSDEVGDLAKDVTSMLHTINAQIDAQQQLLHDVSHELRAPLARLQAITALLEQKPEKMSVHGEKLHQEFERIDLLIRKILEYSRLEQAYSNTQKMDLSAEIDAQIKNLKLESPQRNISFTSPQSVTLIDAYPELAACAIENVLRNADKYSPLTEMVEITIKEGEGKVELYIRDHGNGVDDDELEKLKKPFYRANNVMHGDGFGLGLSIAKRAMEKHKGKLQLNNHPEGGFEVCLMFPLKL